MRKHGLEKRLLKLVREYNPDFTQEEMESLINEGSLDFFFEATETIPETDIHRSNAKHINAMYDEVRASESITPEKWRSEQYLGLTSMPTASTYIGKSDYLNTEDKFIMNAFNEGGYVDLFEHYDQQPQNLKNIVDNYMALYEDGASYSDTQKFLEEVESIGYTFDYYLDNEPYGLRPKGIELNQLQGYEEFENGGQVKTINDKLVYRGDDNRLTIIGTIRNIKGQKRVYKSPFSKVFIKENTDELVENWAKENGYTVWKEDFGDKYAGGGSTYERNVITENKNEVYIEFLNKDKNFTKDRKSFKTYEDAVKWGKENFDKFNTDMIRYYSSGGQLSDVSDMLPHSEPMGVIQPMNIMETVQPMYAGGGDLKPIPEGNKGLPKLPKEVRNRMGYMNNGGSVHSDIKRALQNQDIINLIHKNGMNRLSYSDYELSQLENFISPNELPKDLSDAVWGLVIENSKSSLMSFFKNATALVINSSTGNLLRYPFIHSMPMVDAINSDRDENHVARLLCKAENVNIYSDALKTLNEYDLIIINNSIKANLSDLIFAKNKSKQNNLVIFVCPTRLLYGNNNEKTFINENFEVVTMFLLENKSMDVCISVLKTK